MSFVLNENLAGLAKAEYNPRAINPSARKKLRESIAEIGCCKPLLVNRKNNVVVAGHQRLTALRSLKKKSAPIYWLDGLTKADELRFNQLHNGTEFDSGDENVVLTAATDARDEFVTLEYGAFTGNKRAKLGPMRKDMMHLMMRYGNWGCAVFSPDGKCLHAAQYALACLILRWPLRAFITSKPEQARKYLGQQYGKFSYDHLEKTTYTQAFAQLPRLKGKQDGRQTDNKSRGSTLYDQRVVPVISGDQRILDFGCGQGDYVKRLAEMGYNIRGLEFFPRNGAEINITRARNMIEAVLDDLRENGLYDVVVCDSVMNSVDSLEAETAVLTTVNALCRPGGKIFLSGRSTAEFERNEKATKGVRRARSVSFPDCNNFSAIYSRGAWLYQKFHDWDEVEAFGEAYIGNRARAGVSSMSWHLWGEKTIEVSRAEAEKALSYEFSLPLPSGRYEYAERAVEAWKAALNL